MSYREVVRVTNTISYLNKRAKTINAPYRKPITKEQLMNSDFYQKCPKEMQEKMLQKWQR